MEIRDTLQWLETVTPVQLLTEANNGFGIRDIDEALIKELQEKGFHDSVINVLLYFVLLRSRGIRFDMVREMAELLIEKNITTFQEAIEVAEGEDLNWKISKEKKKFKQGILRSGRY